MDAMTSEGAVNGKELQCEHPNCEAMIRKPARGQKYCSMYCKDQLHKLEREVGRKRLTSNGMHYASLDSPILQIMLTFLGRNGKVTSKEIMMGTCDCGWRATISALRKHGYVIACEFKGTFAGRKRYEYELTGRA